MADQPGSLEQLALGLGRMLAPLESRLESGAVLELLSELGLSLPPQLTAQQGFLSAIENVGASAGQLPQVIAKLSAAIEAEDAASAILAGEQMIEIATHLVQSLPSIAQGLQAAAGSLQGVDQAALDKFAKELPERLLDYVIIAYLESFHPVASETLELLGIIERASLPGVAGDQTQPPFTRRALALDRLGKLLTSPLELAQTIYGWGDQTFTGAELLLRLQGLLSAAGMAASFEPATATTPPHLSFLLLTVQTDTGESPPGLKATLSIPLQDGVALKVPLFMPGWSALIETHGELDAGVSVELAPPSSVAVKPPSGTANGSISFGFLGEPAIAGGSMILFGQSDGSHVQADSIKVAAGVAFSWDTATKAGSGAFTLGGGVAGGKVVIDLSQGDGFISDITGGQPIESNFSLEILWSADAGLRIEGSGALVISIPTHISLGPIEIEQIVLSSGIAANGSLPTELSGSFSADLGPLQASVQRIGLLATLSFPSGGGNLGPAELDLAFKPPNGVGLTVEAGVVTGGGFLYIEPEQGQYAGALQLELAEIVSVAAVGLISTKNPDGTPGFSLLIIITAEFGAGIQLGFGLTLNAVGGLLGLNRMMLAEALMAGVKSDAIESVMFPKNVVANAPKIISDLKAIFPPQPGTFLIGPMAKLGWGEPTLVSASLGVIVEIPPGDIAILGVLKVVLPAEELEILRLQVNFAGALEFSKSRLYFYASLYDSHLLFITIQGGMGLLVAWGSEPNFVVSVGGFNPRFVPPPLPFPTPQRVQVDILEESFARVRAEGYFAVTSNTVQFGAHVEMFFGFSALSVEGQTGLDALVQFSPFMFIVEISTSFSVKVFGLGVFGVGMQLTIQAPTPWHVHGAASISLLFFSIEVPVDITFGEARNTTLPPVAVMAILGEQLGKRSNWKAQLPTGSHLLVSLRTLAPEEADLVLHPVGTLQVSQRAIPLELTLDKVGSQRPSDANRFSLSVTSSGMSKTRELQEPFAPAQFIEADDATRLSEPAFSPQDSGLELAPEGDAYVSGTTLTRVVRYDLTIVDTTLAPPKLRRFHEYPPALFEHWLGGNSASRSVLSAHREALTHPNDGSVAVQAETYAVANQSDNTQLDVQAGGFTSRVAAIQHMNGRVASEPALAGTLQVLPDYEVVAA
jgi:hypothetical protein